MNELEKDFLQKSTANLEKIKGTLLNEGLSETWRREAFRTLHTIKGTAQIFGFNSSGCLAHNLENLLSAVDSFSSENFKDLFTKGIELLKNSFNQKNFEISAQFIEDLNKYLPKTDTSSTLGNLNSVEIPGNISAQLSQAEKITLEKAIKSEKNICTLEIGFDLADFTDRFKDFRETLSKSGEIIATTSSSKFISKIGFQILFASAVTNEKINEIAYDYSAEIVFHTPKNNFPNDLRGVLSKVAAHGESLSKKLCKKIDFEIFAEEINLSAEKLKRIFDILLHLIRNAVDHAFKTLEGTINIQFKKEKDGFYLIVADNGNGIDLDKLKYKAIEKNLISADENLNGQATIDLIFQSELSTATEITEISGRGIGLDAVKNAVENAGGKISVNSEAGKGTTFEIFLPE